VICGHFQEIVLQLGLSLVKLTQSFSLINTLNLKVFKICSLRTTSSSLEILVEKILELLHQFRAFFVVTSALEEKVCHHFVKHALMCQIIVIVGISRSLI